MCGSLIKGPKKASKGWLNEIDSTEKGEKKKRNCRAREKWNSCCSLKFLGRLNRNKICRLFVLQKKRAWWYSKNNQSIHQTGRECTFQIELIFWTDC